MKETVLLPLWKLFLLEVDRIKHMKEEATNLTLDILQGHLLNGQDHYSKTIYASSQSYQLNDAKGLHS